MEIWRMMRKNDRDLEEENKRLTSFLLHQQEMSMDGNVREMENGYHQRGVRDYHNEMPFAFRVQPMQPNLQERI
ncbi:hypothetical protein RJ641_029451 [Dillenia turbinata]|uniref:Uncharacterized protein n=1 Tax=Dillenia turbinata TaxID=194707 RepID=A0AAN8VTF3_9MAGN